MSLREFHGSGSEIPKPPRLSKRPETDLSVFYRGFENMVTTTKQTVSKPQPPLDPIAAAEQTITRLQQKREQIVAERAKAEGDTSKHSYAAHAIGDVRAVEELDQIAANISRLDARVREIDLALAEAGRVHLEARQAEARAADRQRAEEAHKLMFVASAFRSWLAIWPKPPAH
jgi:hypothetical protein